MAAGGGVEVGSLGAYELGRLSLTDFECPVSQRPSLRTLPSEAYGLIPDIDMQDLLAELQNPNTQNRNPNAQGRIPIVPTESSNSRCDGSDQKKPELEILREAVSSCGFFQVRNHSVPISALRTLSSFANRFFAMPLQQKLDITNDLGSLTANSFRSGYMSGSPLHCPLKWWCESLKVDKSTISALPISLWHEDTDEQSFCDALEACEAGFASLAELLCRILLQELGVDVEEVLKENFDRQEAAESIKLSHYPACPQPDKILGLPGHTDICLLTVLWQDEVGGLQVLGDGRWIDIKPHHDALVVNVGDIFQAWSNDRFKSGFHRVSLNVAKSRYSIGSFYNPSSKSPVAPLPQLLKVANESPKFKSMLDADYRKFGFSQLFQDHWQGVECLRY